jgi:COMPASS component SWD2
MDSGPGSAQRAPMTKVQDIIHTFRPSKQFKSPASYTSVDFDDTGEFALLARTDDTIQLFNTKAGAHAKELKSQKYGNALARFTHNSSNIIYASTKVDHGIRYLCMHDNSFIRYFKGHEDRVTSLSLSPGSDHFLSASLDNTVRLWDCRSPNPQGQLNFTSAYLTAYDPSATVIAIASPPAQTVFLYDLKNFDKAPFASFDLLDTEQRFSNSHGMKVAEGWSGLEFSNNGKYLLIATSGAGHYVLDAFDGKLVHYLRRPSGSTSHLAPGDPLPTSGTSTYTQADASFSPDGRYVIGGNGTQNGLLVWDVQDKEGQAVLEPATELPSQRPATVVGYNPRHNMITTAEKEVLFWVPDPE